MGPEERIAHWAIAAGALLWAGLGASLILSLIAR